ncbi:hypothetical protein IX51_04505 [uncultured archaeon]|nr:hypothetical protein IX51_04505 [uncultured archaeon]
MTLTPAQIDHIANDLKSLIRVEKKSKKVKKLDGGFYKGVVDALETLRSESEKHLKNQDISSYININNRIQDIERDFKDFFQRRFSKMAILSLYELDSDLMNSLTGEEREFVIRLHNMMQDEFNRLLLKERVAHEEEVEEPELQPADEKEEPVRQQEIRETHEQAAEKKFILVRIVGDQPPIAQPERDYYLHDNDLVYLPENFAELLVKRKTAVKVNIRI